MSNRTRVLIVDDSASVRVTLRDIIAGDPDLEVMATAADPYAAAEQIRRSVPDVIILDIEMPRMDGLTFLRKIMAQRPIPVVMCSSLLADKSDVMMQALESGAVDIILKPRIDTKQHLMEAAVHICDVVKAAAEARSYLLTNGRRPPARGRVVPAPKLTADAVLPAPKPGTGRVQATADRLVCIGASTGGTEALRAILEPLSPDCPGIVIVQHMPERFTAAFARRLDQLCRIDVKEAENGDVVRPGRALIAPGNFHMMLHRNGGGYRIEIADGPLVSRHRPSVDVLFRSAARAAGANALGILMTGMGDDGARGLLEMRQAGALTIAQDEASCVVFGMPREAIELGAAQKTVALQQIPSFIIRAGSR